MELCVEYVGRRLREITTTIAPGAGESGQGPGEAVDVIAKKLVEMEFEVGPGFLCLVMEHLPRMVQAPSPFPPSAKRTRTRTMCSRDEVPC